MRPMTLWAFHMGRVMGQACYYSTVRFKAGGWDALRIMHAKVEENLMLAERALRMAGLDEAEIVATMRGRR